MPQTYTYDHPPHWALGFEMRVLAYQLEQSSMGVLEWRARHLENGPAFRVQVQFQRDLFSGEVAELDALVAAHDPDMPVPAGRTVAQLNAALPVRPGRTAYARDGRKTGETPGSGSGVLAYSDGTSWRSTDGGALEA